KRAGSSVSDRRSYRPILEVLESRNLLAVAHWNSAVSGNWNTPGNWSTGAVPGAGDEAVIDATGAAYTVTLNINASVARLTLASPDATFAARSRSLTVSDAAALSA